MIIPFVKPPMIGKEFESIKKSLGSYSHSGGGPFTKECQQFLENKFQIKKSILTTSCTSALEVASILINGKNEDEVIVPSFTFSSTVNAFAMRGMKPVYVDVRKDTLNINEKLIEEAITKKTKAIVPIHYAGIPAEMDEINKIAKKYGLIVIEDAAQAVNSKYKNKYAGSLSDIGAFSFHASKAYSCGEGGAITLNNEQYFDRVEYIVEKGTDRSLVVQGLQNKYSWVDYGSSFLPSDILASLLISQLKNKNYLQEKRKKLFDSYKSIFENYEQHGIKFINPPKNVESNYHAFWIILNDNEMRDQFLQLSMEYNIFAYIGYIPLHTSKMGVQLGGLKYDLPITDDFSQRIVRLPFYIMNRSEINYVSEIFNKILSVLYSV
jgi:dTDP-4-amino-4,6-dideoxygalactose transaminase